MIHCRHFPDSNNIIISAIWNHNNKNPVKSIFTQELAEEGMFVIGMDVFAKLLQIAKEMYPNIVL